MENRFKFRFWNKEYKAMSITHYNEHMSIENVYFIGVHNDDCIIESIFDCFNNKSFVPMQCTGLKDKNGKLIFEGDIVDTKYGKYEIKYCNKCKQFQLFIGNYCYACNGDIHWEEFIENVNKTKIIGNIYENKDLLEE